MSVSWILAAVVFGAVAGVVVTAGFVIYLLNHPEHWWPR